MLTGGTHMISSDSLSMMAFLDCSRSSRGENQQASAVRFVDRFITKRTVGVSKATGLHESHGKVCLQLFMASERVVSGVVSV